MLERAKGCLDIGRRHLRTPRRSVRSRRSLHSAFWCHGAGDIDLPSWWISLLQLPSSEKAPLPSQRTTKASNSLSFQSLRGGFLDFLYPIKSLALLHKLAVDDPVNLRIRARRATSRDAVRAYTSGVTEANSEPSETYPENHYHPTSPTIAAKHGATSALIDTEYDLAWQRYHVLQRESIDSTPDELPTLLEHIRVRGDILEVKRGTHVLDLMDKIPISKRPFNYYNYAIQAALHLDDLGRALTLHGEACSRFKGSFVFGFGTSSLLQYLIEHENWNAAVESWYDSYWGAEGLWDGVDSMNLESLVDKASKVADTAIGNTEGTGWDGNTKLRDFAVQLILRAFKRREPRVDLPQHEALWAKLESLTEPTSQHFHIAFEPLLSTKRKDDLSAAISMYTSNKKKYPKVVPEKDLLNKFIIRLHEGHSSYIEQAFNDYRHHHGVPSQRAYRMIIKEKSLQGIATAVYSLLREYQSRFGNLVHPEICEILLTVHSRRAEINKVVSIFNELPERFGFIPNLHCWNILIASHARVNDLKGALDTYNRLLESELEPDAETFGTLMHMFGHRGDVEAIQNLLEECEELGIQKTCFMINSLVLAHVNSNEFEEAESVVKQTLTWNLKKRARRMWNHLLWPFAIRGDVEKVSLLFESMREANVPPDGYTFAALMETLCKNHQPSAAYKLLRVVMPENDIQVTGYHYSIVMGGLLRIRQYHWIFSVYGRMLRQNIKPGFNTHIILLRAAAEIDNLANQENGTDGSSARLERAEALLDHLLKTIDPSDIAAPEPISGSKYSRLDEVYPSAYFEHLIFLYGRQGAFDKVAQLYDQYVAIAKRFRSDVDFSPPVKMICALMQSHLRNEDHDKIKQLWFLAVEKTEPLARRLNAVDEPKWVLSNCRRALERPLFYYMNSLIAQDRVNDIGLVIDHLQTCGYSISNKAWNLYVQVLARSKQRLKAFEICEQELMIGWKGWGKRREIRYGVRLKSRLRKLQPLGWDDGGRMPNYKTLVALAGAYLEIQSSNAYSGNTERMMIKSAPICVKVVQELPRIDDDTQVNELRRW